MSIAAKNTDMAYCFWFINADFIHYANFSANTFVFKVSTRIVHVFLSISTSGKVLKQQQQSLKN
jgi:hypothetical protein